MSAIGKARLENQDRILITSLDTSVLLTVADGMGGMAGGALASETAVRFLESRIDGAVADAEGFARILRDAGIKIQAISQDSALEGMGTTLTGVALGAVHAVWAHSGDSRLYLLRRGGLTQISRDHRFLQDLIDSGDMSPEELARHPLRNVLDQCVGCPGFAPDYGSFDLEEGDLVILTTDGIHDHVSGEKMLFLFQNDLDLPGIANALVAEALSAGSRDDLSVVLCRVGAVNPEAG